MPTVTFELHPDAVELPEFTVYELVLVYPNSAS
jgi:hypothetical protein